METISVALICTVLGVVIGYSNFQRGKKKDTKEEGKTEGATNLKLDYISKGVDDIRLDIKAQDRKIDDINVKLVRVEESTKQAHKRIDRMEE